ncbi:MAG: hypothetical protein IT422_16750 [Pirellulaceae bacterium]|nr:hypothetical protein [Pirellulaceae bacterium]
MSNSTNKILEYLGDSPRQPEIADDVYSPNQYRAFGFVRKPVSNEPMIRFIKLNGVQKSLAYSHLYDIDFDPRTGITIDFTQHIVEIKGRGLLQGFERMSAHRVIFVAEADRPTAVLVPEGEPVITGLEIKSKYTL